MPMLFWGTFLKVLWLCLCWVIPIFLCCVCANSLNSLHELNTLLNPTVTYLSTNNLGAHHFHLNCDAFGDLCLRNFPLAAHVPLLALWRCRMILSGFFLLSLQLRKSWKILYQKSFKDFFVCLRNFPSSPRLCLVLSCTSNVSLGTQCTWEATHVLILVVNHCGRWYSNDQSWFLTGLMLGVRTRMPLAFHLFFLRSKGHKGSFF